MPPKKKSSKKTESTKRAGDKKFNVSIASNVGGGKVTVFARTPKEAASKAANLKLLKPKKGLRKSSVSAIVTNAKTKKQSILFPS